MIEYVYIHAHLYIYIYIYIYMYICMYVYIYIYGSVCVPGFHAFCIRQTKWRFKKNTINMVNFFFEKSGLFVCKCELVCYWILLCLCLFNCLHVHIYVCLLMYWHASLYPYTYFCCLLMRRGWDEGTECEKGECVREGIIHCCARNFFFSLTLW